MRRTLDVSMLKKIAEIRRLQLAAAEAELGRANSVLSRNQEALKFRGAEEKAAEMCWENAVLAPSLQLETLPMWAETVTRQNALTQKAANAVEAAVLACDTRTSALIIAERRRDIAAEMARHVWNERKRKLEEDAVQEAADRHLQNGGRA